MQKKISKSRFIKSTFKLKKKKKSNTKPLDPCPYYIKLGYFENKYYYKYSEDANEDFWQKFQT